MKQLFYAIERQTVTHNECNRSVSAGYTSPRRGIMCNGLAVLKRACFEASFYTQNLKHV